MGRISRKAMNANYYHIMEQGINREFIFKTTKNKEKILKTIMRQMNDEKLKLYAYCVMDNHIHLLVKCENTKHLSETMHKINTSYAIYYNKINKRVGFVFRDRYRAEPIFDIFHLRTCVKYIHDNPVKAGIVKRARDYQYSSCFDYELGKIDSSIIKEIGEYDPEEEYVEEKFIDVGNEYWQSNQESFDEIRKEYENVNFSKKENVIRVSNEIKKRCLVEHSKIYKFMGLSKATYYRKLKGEE